MNPFLHDPVATAQAPSRLAAPRTAQARPGEPPSTGAKPGDAKPSGAKPARARRHARWPRAIGRLALAAGLALMALPGHALDLNSATVDQLRAIRGVGPKTAETIVKERERGGRFESMEDLSDRVRGIGPRRAQALEAAGLRVTAGGTAPDQASPGMRPASGQAAGGHARPGVARQDPARTDPARPDGKDPRGGRVPPRGTR
ncbi:ComEA family DNA-binding protein [Bordetella bronchialis]|uniref:ComEA family DNA-binding protein n=1 Tax=Bordetella bronchialis TaxID=463025 RepID=UPI0009F2B4D4|nr:helix-hairpin-helix domain-containing protein [Bordetella bronchialis]